MEPLEIKVIFPSDADFGFFFCCPKAKVVVFVWTNASLKLQFFIACFFGSLQKFLFTLKNVSSSPET